MLNYRGLHSVNYASEQDVLEVRGGGVASTIFPCVAARVRWSAHVGGVCLPDRAHTSGWGHREPQRRGLHARWPLLILRSACSTSNTQKCGRTAGGQMSGRRPAEQRAMSASWRARRPRRRGLPPNHTHVTTAQAPPSLPSQAGARGGGLWGAHLQRAISSSVVARMISTASVARRCRGMKYDSAGTFYSGSRSVARDSVSFSAVYTCTPPPPPLHRTYTPRPHRSNNLS